MPRKFKWQPHAGERHAIPQQLAIGDAAESLCGLEMTVRSDTWKDGERCWPTCHTCDREWRADENLLPWPRDGKAADVVREHAAR